MTGPPAADPGHAAVLQAHALNELGRFEQALQVCRASLASSPDDPDLLLQAAVALLNLDRPREAVHVLERAAAARPDEADVHRLLSAALLGCGESRPASEAARVATRLSPDDPAAHVQQAQAAGACGEHAEARRAAESAVRLGPNLPATHLALAQVLVRPGARPSRRDARAAEQQARLALELEPGHAGALDELSRIALARGRRAEAAARVAAAVRAAPTDAAALANADRLVVNLVMTLFALGVVIWVIGVRVLTKNSEALSPGFIAFIGSLGAVTLALGLWLVTRRIPRDMRRGFLRRFVGQQRWGRWWAAALAGTTVLWVSSALTSGGVSIVLYLASGVPLLVGVWLAVMQESRYEKADKAERTGA